MFKNIFKVLRLVSKYWRYIVLSVSSNFLAVFFSLFSITMAMPFLSILFEKQQMVMEKVPFDFSTHALQHNFNYFLSQLILDKGNNMALAVVSLFIIITSLFKAFFTYFSVHFISPVRNRAIEDIRNKLFSKVLSLPLSYYSNEKKGDIISRMTNDVKEVEISVVSSLQMIFLHPITILVYLSSLIWISPRLTMIVLIIIPFVGIVLGRIGKVLNKQSRQGMRLIGSLVTVMDETLFGLRIIKAFNAEDKIQEHFISSNRLYTRLMTNLFRRRSSASPITEFLGSVIMVSIMWYGASLVLGHQSTLTAEAFIAYILIFSQIISPAKGLSTAYYNIQNGLASIERINEVMNADIKILEKKDAISVNQFKESIEYKDVSFKYNREFVLKHIDLKVKKGQMIALVGQSGSGKSTLVDLLPRFFDTTEGQILLDGIPITDYKIKDYRSLFGIVNQEPILFNDTFFNNIAFGIYDAKIEDVKRASKIANAYDFIMQYPNNFYTNIGDRGNKLSGGQRQRISIARAVLKNPPILILDEATSSLDSKSEKLVQEALDKLMENRTSIVVAHRLSTIFNADEIIVLHEGQIVERGKHTDLLALNGYYKKLYDLQIFS